MINLFRQPKPRRFEHINIYADDRKERLREIVARARQHADGDDKSDFDNDGDTNFDREAMQRRLHESFTADMRHLRKRERRHANGMSMNIGIVVIIILCVFLLGFMVFGHWNY